MLVSRETVYYCRDCQVAYTGQALKECNVCHSPVEAIGWFETVQAFDFGRKTRIIEGASEEVLGTSRFTY